MASSRYIAALLLAACVCSLAVLADARSPPKSKKPSLLMVILGDSLSDTGNNFKVTNGTVPDPDFYWKGHYSNGPIWVEYMSEVLKKTFQLTVKNYAYGGATACPSAEIYARAPFVKDEGNQTAMFLADLASGKIPKADKTLYFEWAVSMDIINYLVAALQSGGLPTMAEVQATITSIVKCRVATWTKLAMAGAKDMVLFSAGCFDRSGIIPDAYRKTIKQVLDALDAATAAAAKQVQAQFDAAPEGNSVAGANLYFLNMQDVWNNSAAWANITILNAACVAAPTALAPLPANISICTNVRDHFFVDNVHPNTLIHKYAALKFMIPNLQQLHLLPAGL